MLLDNLINYKKSDTGKVAASIRFLPDQVRQVLEEARLIKIPREYNKITQVVINGMGGSNLGANIIKSVFEDQLKVPLAITPGYEVPASVDKNTLYVISSYSGTTEEPLSVYREVKNRGAKIMGITMNSKKSRLARLMIRENIPGYIFKPGYNPSNLPRLGTGYMLFGTHVLLAKTGLLKIKVREIENIISDLEIRDRELRPEIPAKINLAKMIALKLSGRQPIIVTADFLAGNAHALRNQFCETSKNFSDYLVLPDLNHFALESLANPAGNKKNLIFFFINSSFYHPRVLKRLNLTKQIVKKNKINFIEYGLQSETKLKQSFQMLQIGSWIAYYLAILNHANPGIIPYVDWFKKKITN